MGLSFNAYALTGLILAAIPLAMTSAFVGGLKYAFDAAMCASGSLQLGYAIALLCSLGFLPFAKAQIGNSH
jgi:hypothetical protein